MLGFCILGLIEYRTFIALNTPLFYGVYDRNEHWY